MDNDRPIIFKITYVTDSKLKVYTEDGRWADRDLLPVFDGVSPFALFDCTKAITFAGRSRGLMVLFEVA